MDRQVISFGPALAADFDRLHALAEGGGCYCVAWWVLSWDGWGERTAEQNRALRAELCRQGHYDGYLLYLDGLAVGWCQAGPRDRLEKLARQFALPADPSAWAISCFYIDAAYRRQGHARYLLDAVLADLDARGVRWVEAFPKRGPQLEAGDLWNGPEALFLSAGFQVLRDDPLRPVLVRQR